MPLGRMVSTGRGNFTFRMSLETGARFRRSTLLVGVDLSCADSPWLQAAAESAIARRTAADPRRKNLEFSVCFIDFLIALRAKQHIAGARSQSKSRVVA